MARAVLVVLAAFTAVTAAVIGVALGYVTAETANIRGSEDFMEFNPALPTRILDVHGELITEFAGDERRELVALDQLPTHLINAVLTREDADFFRHPGFSIRGTIRAAVGVLQGVNRGGGSTITQQIAGILFTDRADRSLKRKVVELWWALQLERRFSKNEILELYLNYAVMGPGVFGVEAASRYFFGHSAKDINLAESAIIAIQLSSPSRHNPLTYPEIAMDRQRAVLDRMVELGLADRDEADRSFGEFWGNFDYTRASVGAFFLREDKAPWFSEYVRRQLEDTMFGKMDYFRDGYTVHTTLDLRHQAAAEKYMTEGLARANSSNFQSSTSAAITRAERTYMPVINLLSLTFDFTGIHQASIARDEHIALSRYANTVNPIVDMAALLFGIPELKEITVPGFDRVRLSMESNDVEGALITIENDTGYITALVGGSQFSQTNQFIRATQANVQVGSAFKPLFFSAAIDSRRVTAASLLYDVPMVFDSGDGTQYIPINYNGVWNGGILLHRALSLSLNIPALKVLDIVGFDAAIDRAASLLGITNENQKRAMFPRVYPLALGVTSTSPLNMARAFSVFANEGREVTPIAIRRIEDRNGKVIMDPEQDLMEQRRRNGTAQVVSPQNAYVMNTLLSRSAFEGTMGNAVGGGRFRFRDENGRDFTMPIAGKTGTTQNWADAWVVGYSPYYTTAIWFGFDRPGNSLGVVGTGSILVGPVWGNYMRDVHQGLGPRQFVRPSSGVVFAEVSSVSGLLLGPDCDEGRVTLPFLQGTQPTEFCDIHGGGPTYRPTARSRPAGGVAVGSFTLPALPDFAMPSLPSFLEETWADVWLETEPEEETIPAGQILPDGPESLPPPENPEPEDLPEPEPDLPEPEGAAE